MHRLSTLLKSDIEEKATTFRINNGYSAIEPIQLSRLLLKKNILTVFRKLPTSFGGMAIKVEKDLMFMMINHQHTIGKQHFTIGHELYHLNIQVNFDSRRCETGLFENQKEIEEYKADYFSACLLLPEAGIINLIPASEKLHPNMISDETIFKVHQYYGVSINAVIFRLNELGIVNKNFFDKFATGKINMALRLGFEATLLKPGNKNRIIGDYGLLVSNLYRNHKISETHYLELLNDINIDPFAINQNDLE